LRPIGAWIPRKDLHGLTVFGEKIARHHGVLVVRADAVLLAPTVDRLKPVRLAAG
jgi:hypothetical protein